MVQYTHYFDYFQSINDINRCTVGALNRRPASPNESHLLLWINGEPGHSFLMGPFEVTVPIIFAQNEVIVENLKGSPSSSPWLNKNRVPVGESMKQHFRFQCSNEPILYYRTKNGAKIIGRTRMRPLRKIVQILR